LTRQKKKRKISNVQRGGGNYPAYRGALSCLQTALKRGVCEEGAINRSLAPLPGTWGFFYPRLAQLF